jgi:RND family efflux transporter MFP subunit
MAIGKAKLRAGTYGIAVAILIGGTCLFWPIANAQQTEPETQSALPNPETVPSNTEVSRDEVRGLLVPRRQAKISSLVGARVKNIYVKAGDRFKKGKTLISFECDVLVASLQSARARLKQYEVIYETNIELRKDNAVSELDYALSSARVEEGEADANLARAQLRKCEVKAPYNGRVVEVIVNEYESVEVGADLIAILDDSQLEMVLHVPSKWVASVTKDKKFKVGIDETGKSYDAVVVRTSPNIDPTSRTLQITAQIAGVHPELLAGMSGDVSFNFLQ